MASAPQQQSLPLFYNGLEPLSSELHANYKIQPQETAPFLANQHAIPVTVDEFALIQRFMPIVFSSGDDSVPLALMGMNEGVNVFVGDNGELLEPNIYVPAYVRRYPYMLARLRPDAQELSLCFDPTSPSLGEFDDGQALFEDGQPTEVTRGILAFAESFEQAGARTQQFMAELREMDLLMDGEMSIQPEGATQPFIYRGFQMVNEEKLNDLRGDQLRKMMKSGMLPLLHAHLFSLSLMRDVFGRQLQQGKAPQPEFVN
ncbi:SapC protein [Sphingomonas gellani]|uniref:SapC protein n=1 Tax=Sphingomonas gellani TaxID=1166340 RepID=A0A1H8BK34_9SPHN|nr:SapC family protein [Sphingomonas gellani]SEM82504.1 SapC protein [Sphingomonas gellani]